MSGSFKVRMMMRNNKIPAEIPFLKVTSVIFGDRGFEKAVYDAVSDVVESGVH